MEDMAYYCDNVIVMNDSKVFSQGTVKEIFSEAEALEKIGLDIPSIAKIAIKLKAAGIPLDGKLYTVDGVKEAVLKIIRGEKV